MRNLFYIIMALITQCLNVGFIAGTVYRHNTPISSLIVGGLGRILIDGWLLYLSFKGKTWAKVILILLWIAVIVFSLLCYFFGNAYSPKAKAGILMVSIAYMILSFSLALGYKLGNKQK